MDKNNMLKPALIGGAAFGIISALPFIGMFNCFCCAWAIGGGILAASLYVKGSPLRVTLGQGALTGLVAGVIGSIIYGVITYALLMAASTGGGGNEDALRYIQEQLSSNPEMPPEVLKAIEELSRNPNLSRISTIAGIFFNFIFFSLFALLGGTIGVAIFEKRRAGDV